MKINKNLFIIYYFFLYATLLVGYYFGEDFAGGFRGDYETHNMLITNLFNKSIVYGLINYDIYYVPHSPIFIIYILILQKIFIFDDLLRLINLHFSLLIPLFVGLSLKLKYNLKNNDIRYFLPSIFFISPYFRSGSIWMDDNIFAIIFLSISIYFFIKYEKDNLNLKNILLSALFLALTAYFRPIYSILSIYFFLRFYFDLKFNQKLIYYIIFNIILSLPAIYYIYILEINKWATAYLFRENIFTLISLVSSVLVFYFIPFLIREYKLFKKQININYLILFIAIIILILFNFEYNRNYSGGIILKISNLLFDNNYLFYFISSLCILIIYILFFSDKYKKKYFDILLIFILFLLEIDGVIYHETYDPLIYLFLLLLFNNKIFVDYIRKFSVKNYLILFSFLLTFYLMAIYKTILL